VFCIDTKVLDSFNVKTDVEAHIKKLETTCHSNTFRTICREITVISGKLINQLKNKKIRNISDNEYSTLVSLKKNSNIVIRKADRGNCIVVLDDYDDVKKLDDILVQK
jgi:hypothetical protein